MRGACVVRQRTPRARPRHQPSTSFPGPPRFRGPSAFRRSLRGRLRRMHGRPAGDRRYCRASRVSRPVSLARREFSLHRAASSPRARIASPLAKLQCHTACRRERPPVRRRTSRRADRRRRAIARTRPRSAARHPREQERCSSQRLSNSNTNFTRSFIESVSCQRMSPRRDRARPSRARKPPRPRLSPMSLDKTVTRSPISSD